MSSIFSDCPQEKLAFGGPIKLLGLPHEVKAAGDADEVFLGDGAEGDFHGVVEGRGDLGHFSVELDVSGGELFGVGGADGIDLGEDDLVSAAGDALEHAGDILVGAAAEND